MKKLVYYCDRCKNMISVVEKSEFEKRNIKLLDYNRDPFDICSRCFESLLRWFGREPEGKRSCQFCKHGAKSVEEKPCSECRYIFEDKFEPKENEGR